jgi:GT2 family glycosyltransferase/glycosyltransferase involved in cell wall biosynthesis
MVEEFRHNVSVVIVNHDRLETTLKSVECVRQSVGDHVREIIVVDNGSGPDVVAGLESLLPGKARIVTLGVNRYFGEGNNIGVEESTGDFILLLNNDAYVEPDCIAELVGTMQRDSGVAAVGPMFLYPNRSVQEVGGIVLETGDIAQIGKGAVWGCDHYTQECAVDYCSAACLLFRKRDFIQVGGFSLQWEPAYFEDADLCLSFWHTAGSVLVNPRARVVHVESMTTGDAKMRLESQVEINRLSFVEKWGDWLKARQRLSPQLVGQTDVVRRSVARDVVTDDTEHGEDLRRSRRGSTRIGTAVLYTPYELIPGGGERYLFELASVLTDTLGQEHVKIASPHRYSNLRIRQMSDAFGLCGPTESITLDRLKSEPPDMTVVLGNEVVPPIPGFGRHHNVYMCQFPFQAPGDYLQRNLKYIDTFDEIWVNSNFTRRYVNGNLALLGVRAPTIRIISPPASLPRRGSVPDWGSRSAVMTVGRFFEGGHNKRQDVVIEIVKQLSMRLGRSVPLVMAGSLHASASSRDRFRNLQAMTNGMDCHIYPNVRRDRLINLYSTSAVIVHAAGYGVDKYAFPERLEHFGIVPVEAASVGCIPVVFGEGGPVEVMAALNCPTTFHSIAEAVDRIEGLFDDSAGSTKLSSELIERSDLFSSQAFRRRVYEALDGVL